MNANEKRIENMKNDLIEQIGDIRTATREELDIFVEKNINNYSQSTKKTKMYILNKILRENEVEIFIKNTTKNDTIDIDGVYTVEEMKKIVDSLLNPMDQFIVWSIFNGVYGTAAKDLLSIKKSDFKEKERTLTIGVRVIQLDDYYFNIVKNACEQKVYMKNNLGGIGRTNEDYELNEKNPYIIRGKMTTKNNNGLNIYGYAGFARKIRVLAESSGCIIKADSLYSSFLMNEMLQERFEFNTYNLKKWLKEKDYKANNEILMKKYNLKYKG